LEPIPWQNESLLSFPRGRHAEFRSKPAKVTVFVPVYNGGANLQRCLDSIAAQTFSDYQAIIIDNGSTDASFSVASRLAKDHPQLLVYQTPTNVGRVGNWNRGLELATGQYLKPLLVNDYLKPECLAKLAAVMDEYPGLVLVRGSIAYLNNGEELFTPRFEFTQ